MVERLAGTAAEFHGRALPAPPARRVWVHQVRAPALVLGSTQDPGIVDAAAAAAAGVEVVRRRSGGGAVLVEPGGVVWVDVVVPTDDPLWDDDVGRAFTWVGETWAAALATVGVGGARCTGVRLVTTPWSSLVCFGGMGPGEVTVGGAKVVGLAQRRTREGAWFQGAALLRWAPGDLLGLLAPGRGGAGPGRRRPGRAGHAGAGGRCRPGRGRAGRPAGLIRPVRPTATPGQPGAVGRSWQY